MEVKRGSILFRCDATPETGYEAFYQCLSLAAAMQRRRRGTNFLSYLEPLSLATAIHRGNNNWQACESKIGGPGDVEATIREIRRTNAAAVVVNGAGVTAEYLDRLNDTGARVIAIDSEANIKFPSKLVVNPLLAPGKKPFKYEQGTQLLLGRKFALVRAIFEKAKSSNRVLEDEEIEAVVRERSRR